MSRLDNFKAKIQQGINSVRESELYQQLRTKYDELDVQTKFYIHIGTLAAIALFIVTTVFSGIIKMNSLKADIDEREELIGYLTSASDNIRQLKMQQSYGRAGSDVNSPLPSLVQSVVLLAGLDEAKVEISAERPGQASKEATEVLLDIKVTQVNLRQLTKFLFHLTEQGSARNINIKDLNIDTKGDPSGYLDANTTIAAYSAIEGKDK